MADQRRWIDEALDEVDAMTPETGFNVVAVDRGARAGAALYLVEHVASAEAAEALRAEHEKRTGDATHVYVAREPS